MSHGEKLGVVQIGPEGLVAEQFREIVAYPGSPFSLEAVATGNEELIRRRFLGETTLKTPAILAQTPVISLESAYNTDAPVIVSHLSNELALEYEVPLADDRPLLVTTAAANNDRPDVALFNAYADNGQLEELYAELRSGHILGTGSPVAVPIAVMAAPLHAAIGIEGINVETLQGWSDEDKTEVPAGYEGIVSALNEGQPAAVEADIAKMLGTMETPAEVRVNARLNRGPWVYGHQAKVKLHFARPTSKAELSGLLGALEAPESLRHEHYGPGSPKKHPVKLTHKRLLKQDNDTLFRLARTKPMKAKAFIMEVSEDGLHAEIEMVDDNLMFGSAGAAAMNIVYAQAEEYL